MEWNLKAFNELNTVEMYTFLQERTAVFVVEQNCPYLEVDGKDIESYHLFAQLDGEIAAYARILPAGVSYKEASIGRVLVKKAYRGQGLAYDLLKKAIMFIQDDLNETAIKIQAQSHLEKFYASFGFKSISSSYLEDNIPHIDMLLTFSE
ncbi:MULTISPECIES: GNAT family N-acetyltransferase [unclassified Niallia]|uniref:GNAT family N-acetyltransferase n=1 Tax=unclassified Niallia TaxID=2837522 RepID=UPI001EDB8297|nr:MULTISPECIES: GNAT family N-acetyltransferase [unclassified Niallia]MDL0435879.1 GNAT family N-acetyltransferase [Niallia sp. SS-2023]UPO89564.1 GNAT family N-acetyltransferase [Niallia sp. Man26]